MLQEIQKWLANPKRKYSEGLKYFKKFASKKQKETFEKYLNDIDPDSDIAQYDKDGRFPMLVNQVVFIEKRIKASPELFITTKTGLDLGQIKLKDGDPGQTKLQDDTLKQEQELPEELVKARERLKEIIPVMAKIHADMANELADDKRLVLIHDLVALDNERREIWALLDGKVDRSEEEIELDKLTLATGAKIGKRIEQLKENISRNEKSLQTATEKNNKQAIDKVTKKLETYSAELAGLEAAIIGK